MNSWMIYQYNLYSFLLIFYEYFDKFLNVQDGVQASVVAVGGDIRMPVFGMLNNRWAESYNVEEVMSKMKGLN